MSPVPLGGLLGARGALMTNDVIVTSFGGLIIDNHQKFYPNLPGVCFERGFAHDLRQT